MSRVRVVFQICIKAPAELRGFLVKKTLTPDENCTIRNASCDTILKMSFSIVYRYH